MAAEIFDGSLQFTAGIDLSDTESQIQQLEQRLAGIIKITSAANKSIVEMAEEANSAFSVAGLERYSTEIDNLFKSVQSYLQGTFGTEKIQALDEALNAVTDEGEQLKILLQFFKDNSDALDLNPEGAQQMLQNIQAIEAVMEQVEQTAPAAGQAIQNGIATPLGELTERYNQLDALATSFEKQLETETDPVALKKINEELGKIYEELDVVQAKYQAFNNPKFGNIPEAPAAIDLKTADTDQLKAKLVELDGYAQKLREALTLATDPAEAEQYNTELSNTRTRIEEINARFEEMNQKQVRASAQLEQIRNQLATMKPEDAGYQDLLDKAIELENSLKNVNRTVTLLGSNTAGIQALKQGFNGLLGGISAVVSAYSLFADDSDELQKTMLKLFAVMQVVGGAEQFLATVNKNSAVVQYLLAQYRKLTAVATTEQAAAATAAAAAETAQAVATEGAAAAQLSLNAAIAANPIGAILVAITAVVGAISLYIATVESETEAQTKLNQALADTNDLLVQLAQLQARSGEDRVKTAENLTALAEAEGKSQREILDLKTRANNISREEALKQLSFLDVDKQRLQIMEIQLENLLMQRRAIETIPEGDRTKEQKQQLENLQAQEKSIRVIYDYAQGIFKNLQEGNARQQELAAEAEKLARDNALKSTTAAIEARAIAAKKGTQEEYLAQIDAINARRNADLADVNLTAGERVKINAQADRDIADLRRELRERELDDQIALAKAVLANAQSNTIEEFNARLSLINLEAQKQIEADGVTAAKKKQIYAEANKEINDLNRQYNFQASQAEINRAVADINNRLAVSPKGSGEEYDLRRQLMEQQEALDIARAQSQINNEQQLAQRTKEIHAKALVDRKKLDDQYADQWLDRQLKLIKAEADAQNVALQKVLNDPTATQNQQYKAQRGILTNQAKALEDMWRLASNKAKAATGDTRKAAQEAEKFKTELEETNNAIDNLDSKHIIDTFGKIGSTLDVASNALHSFASDLKGVNNGLSDTLDTMADLLSSVGQLAQVGTIIGGVASGRMTAQQGSSAAGSIGGFAGAGAAIGAAFGGFGAPIGAAIGAVVGFVASLLKGGKAVRESIQKTYEAIYSFQVNQELGEYRINQLLRERALLKAQEVKLTLQGLKAQQDALALNQKQNEQEQARILSLLQGEQFITGVSERKYGGFLGLWKKSEPVNQYAALLGMTADQIEKLYQSGQLDGRAKALFEQLQRLQQEGEDIQSQLEALQQQAKEVFTGTTAGSITDSIVDGFANGLFAAQDFADNFEALMRQAALNALKYQYLEEPLQAFYDQFAAAAQSDNVLTAAEIADLQDRYNQIIKNAGEQFQQLQDITGLNLGTGSADQNSLKGAIKGMTEQQAELLAGQFVGLRLTAMEQVQIATQNLSVLNRIKDDTANLASINAELRSIRTVGVKIIK